MKAETIYSPEKQLLVVFGDGDTPQDQLYSAIFAVRVYDDGRAIVIKNRLGPRDEAPDGQESMASTASQILQMAMDTIARRGTDYDSSGGERSMDSTVKAFNAITGHSLTIEEGWQFMAVLKLVRAQTAASPEKMLESALDGAAYMALAGEEALKGKEDQP